MNRWRGIIGSFALSAALAAFSVGLMPEALAGTDSGPHSAVAPSDLDLSGGEPPAVTPSVKDDEGKSSDIPAAAPSVKDKERKSADEKAARPDDHKSDSHHPRAVEATGWSGNKNIALYRAAPGAEIRELSADKIELSRGEVVIEPSRPVTVVTPLAETHLMHRAAVLFRVQKGSERCMVLWDNGPDSVVLISQHHKANLGPGEEALLTDHDPNYREITESDDIGRRRIKLHEVGRHNHVVTAEFSLMHALQRDPLLYDLAHSKDKHDHSLRERILKTAAVLNYVTRGHGYYATTSGF